MRGILYEKLYKENEEFRNDAFQLKVYNQFWKSKFGYSDNVSFDKVLEDLYELKYGKKPY